MTSLVFPETTDRIIPSVSQDSQASSATAVVPACRSLSAVSDITPAQRESAIYTAERRLEQRRESEQACNDEWDRTGKSMYLVLAEIHRIKAAALERQIAELIQGRA